MFIVVGKAVKGDSSDGSNADSVSDDDDRFDEKEQRKKTKSTNKSHADSMYHKQSDYWLKTNDPLSDVGQPFTKNFYDKKIVCPEAIKGLFRNGTEKLLSCTV